MSQVVSLVERFDFNACSPGFYALHLRRASSRLGISFVCDTACIEGRSIGKKDQLFFIPDSIDVTRLRFSTPIHELLRFDIVKRSDDVWEDLKQVRANDDLLSSLNEHQPLDVLLEPLVPELENFPELLKLLTVMSESAAELYERSLYCAWFSVVIANEMRASRQVCLELFLASLAHDLGMLYLNPEVLFKQPPLSQHDWLHIQKHVAIAKRWLIEVGKLPAPVVEAVSEHHERCDGTGYPLGIVESEIGYSGKVLGLADSLIGIYHNRCKPTGRGWRNVIPVIQMNAHEFFYRHEEVLGTLWRRSEMPKKNVVLGNNLHDFFEDIQAKHNELHSWFNLLKESLTTLGFTHGDRQLHSLQNVMIHIATSARGSGIFNPEVAQWFKTVDIERDEGAYKQLDRASVLQQEIRFHLHKLNHMIQSYVASGACTNKKILGVLEDTLAKTQKYI